MFWAFSMAKTAVYNLLRYGWIKGEKRPFSPLTYSAAASITFNGCGTTVKLHSISSPPLLTYAVY